MTHRPQAVAWKTSSWDCLLLRNICPKFDRRLSPHLRYYLPCKLKGTESSGPLQFLVECRVNDVSRGHYGEFKTKSYESFVRDNYWFSFTVYIGCVIWRIRSNPKGLEKNVYFTKMVIFTKIIIRCNGLSAILHILWLNAYQIPDNLQSERQPIFSTNIVAKMMVATGVRSGVQSKL